MAIPHWSAGSLGGPTYRPDERVSEAQRWKALQLEQQRADVQKADLGMRRRQTDFSQNLALEGMELKQAQEKYRQAMEEKKFGLSEKRFGLDESRSLSDLELARMDQELKRLQQKGAGDELEFRRDKFGHERRKWQADEPYRLEKNKLDLEKDRVGIENLKKRTSLLMDPAVKEAIDQGNRKLLEARLNALGVDLETKRFLLRLTKTYGHAEKAREHKQGDLVTEGMELDLEHKRGTLPIEKGLKKETLDAMQRQAGRDTAADAAAARDAQENQEYLDSLPQDERDRITGAKHGAKALESVRDASVLARDLGQIGAEEKATEDALFEDGGLVDGAIDDGWDAEDTPRKLRRAFDRAATPPAVESLYQRLLKRGGELVENTDVFYGPDFLFSDEVEADEKETARTQFLGALHEERQRRLGDLGKSMPGVR